MPDDLGLPVTRLFLQARVIFRKRHSIRHSLSIERAGGQLMSQMGPGCVKTRGSSIPIEQVSRSRPFQNVCIASPLNFEVELKNILLVALQNFEFSHSLGQKLP
jgi:hypothetical protein